jgi:hypothetical protein
MNVTGGCLCKAVRYEIAADPITRRSCWCRLCQYIGAGNATVNAAFPKSAISVSGETRDYRSVADSGSVMHRRFCPVCGTHLFSEAEPRPHSSSCAPARSMIPNSRARRRRSGSARRRVGRASTRRSPASKASRRPRAEQRRSFVANGRPRACADPLDRNSIVCKLRAERPPGPSQRE